MKWKVPKVLIACPTYVGKNYALEEWVKAINGLNYKNYDVLMVDNTNDQGVNAKFIQDTYGIKTIHYYNSQAKSLKHLMAEAQEVMRKYFLDGDYDYLLSLESDVIVPERTIIQRLINHEKDIVCGMYEIGPRGYPYPLLQVLSKDIVNPKNNDLVARQMTWPEIFAFMDGTVKRIFHAGLGCTLISRKILENFTFHCHPENTAVHADSIFAMDMNNNGIPIFVDTGLMCIHRRGDWGAVIEEREKEFEKNE